MNVNVDLMKENVIQIKDRITINVDVSLKKPNVCQKDNVWNPATCTCKNEKYLASIMDDSAIISDEVTDADDETKTISTNFNENKITGKTQNVYILLVFLLITKALLIAVSIY